MIEINLLHPKKSITEYTLYEKIKINTTLIVWFGFQLILILLGYVNLFRIEDNYTKILNLLFLGFIFVGLLNSFLKIENNFKMKPKTGYISKNLRRFT